MSDERESPWSGPDPPKFVGPFSIHSAMCRECGGWSSVVEEVIAPCCRFLKCYGCGEILLSIRTVEP